MEKTDKSALEISLEIVGPLPVPGARKWKAGLGNQDLIIKAMEAYAAQQLSEYKEVIQGLLPIAEFGYSVMNVNHPTLAEAKDIINRAKALLQESN